ncbi:MAG: hypothetical protein HOE80_03940 [Candidatus Magasanikbacteria bacterium]|jgi:hypothetical protein|nr:hypothetical protein [Candidatus Magasanikbacteria bacterium]MBT4071844.1 hypothetical protein [Candidatus Magasanikbacteria bacterium]
MYCTIQRTYFISSRVADNHNLTYDSQKPFEPFTMVSDPHHKDFIPQIAKNTELPQHLKDQFLHLASLIHYTKNTSVETPFLHMQNMQKLWQHMHDIGLVALVGNDPDVISSLLQYYCCMTKRVFFDYSYLKKQIKEKQYPVSLPDDTGLIVSNILLTALSYTDGVLFISKINDLTVDELLFLQATVLTTEPIIVNGQALEYEKNPFICRYIYSNTVNYDKKKKVIAGSGWQEAMTNIIYF